MRRLVSVLISAALVFAACGGGSGPSPSADPKGALQHALDTLANTDGQTVTLGIDSTPDSLVAASEGSLTAEQAQQILDSSLVISAKGDSPDNAEFQMLLNVSGTDGVEIRAVDQNVYVRADVPGLAQVFNAPQAQIDSFVQKGTAQGLDFLQPAVEGKWLSLTGAQQLLQQYASATGASPASSDMQKQAADALSKALDQSATVTDSGSDSIGDHLVASVNIKSFYTAISASLGALAAGGSMGALPSADQIPDGDLKLDVWVSGGAVKQIEFDIKQLATLDPSNSSPMPPGIDTLAVKMTFASFDGGVTAPDGAVPVDLTKILQGMMGATSTSASGSATATMTPGDSTDLCAQLKDAPKDVQKQFAQQCPDLQQ
jgi:hypothetical protein